MYQYRCEVDDNNSKWLSAHVITESYCFTIVVLYCCLTIHNVVLQSMNRIERKERTRLKNVKFFNRDVDGKGVSTSVDR